MKPANDVSVITAAGRGPGREIALGGAAGRLGGDVINTSGHPAMKFSDGHWRIPENLSVQHPLHVHDVRVEGDEVVADVAALEFKTRLDQINATVFTLRLFAPSEGVIGVRITHFEGGRRPGPEFALNRQSDTARIEQDDHSVTLHSGGLGRDLAGVGPLQARFSASRQAHHWQRQQGGGLRRRSQYQVPIHVRAPGSDRRHERLRSWGTLHAVRQERPERGDLERRWRHPDG